MGTCEIFREIKPTESNTYLNILWIYDTQLKC